MEDRMYLDVLISNINDGLNINSLSPEIKDKVLQRVGERTFGKTFTEDWVWDETDQLELF